MDENRFGTDFDIFLESPHFVFLVISEKVGQTFLSTISQSLKDGSLEAYEVTKPMIILE